MNSRKSEYQNMIGKYTYEIGKDTVSDQENKVLLSRQNYDGRVSGFQALGVFLKHHHSAGFTDTMVLLPTIPSKLKIRKSDVRS